MKRYVHWRFLLLSLCACTLVLGCSDDENPMIDLDDTSTLAGSYKLVSVKDESGEMGFVPGMTIVAGDPFTIQIEGVTVTMTVTGTLTLTSTRYAMSMVIKAEFAGELMTDTETDTGTYSIHGSTMTVVSDDPQEGTDTMTISVDGNQLVFTDTETRMVFEKN